MLDPTEYCEWLILHQFNCHSCRAIGKYCIALSLSLVEKWKSCSCQTVREHPILALHWLLKQLKTWPGNQAELSFRITMFLFIWLFDRKCSWKFCREVIELLWWIVDGEREENPNTYLCIYFIILAVYKIYYKFIQLMTELCHSSINPTNITILYS